MVAPADAKIVGQLALGRQLLAGSVAASGDCRGDLPGNLLVQLLDWRAGIHDESQPGVGSSS